MPGLVHAKPVDEGKKLFSVDIPDAWKLDAKANAWSNANNSGALLLRSADVKMSLDDWAKLSLARTPKETVVSKESLGGVPAKRLDFVAPGGYKTSIWIAKKASKGAILTLVANPACPDKIPDVKKKLISSFKWK
jgi:sugar lactone lactonase YvrE